MKGFKKKNYTHETRIKQLSKLQQFRNYTDEQLKEYYYNKVKVRMTWREERERRVPRAEWVSVSPMQVLLE